jgi:hypothetical protein
VSSGLLRGHPSSVGLLTMRMEIQRFINVEWLLSLRLNYGRRRSVGQSVLVSGPSLGPMTRFSFFFSWFENVLAL